MLPAVVAFNPHLPGGRGPPSSQADRFVLAQVQPGQQALLVLAHLRNAETFAGLAAGFGISTATAWRYVSETVTLLAAGPRAARGAGCGHGQRTPPGPRRRPPPIDRVAADRPFYSGNAVTA